VGQQTVEGITDLAAIDHVLRGQIGAALTRQVVTYSPLEGFAFPPLVLVVCCFVLGAVELFWIKRGLRGCFVGPLVLCVVAFAKSLVLPRSRCACPPFKWWGADHAKSFYVIN
jgi:hypothetical protein